MYARKIHTQRLNHELPQFFRENPLTNGKGTSKHYKCVVRRRMLVDHGHRLGRTAHSNPHPPNPTTHPGNRPPQRHLGNQTLLSETDYRTPFLDFFVPGPQPLGVTDVGQVSKRPAAPVALLFLCRRACVAYTRIAKPCC